MEIREIFDLISEHVYVVVLALWVIGYIIKNTEWIKDKYIPVILLVISIGFTPLMLGGYTPQSIVQGVLVAGGAVIGNEIMKQSRKEE